MGLHPQGNFLSIQAHITERLLPFHIPDPDAGIMIFSVIFIKNTTVILW